jgi:hypothetical protein
MTYLARSAGRRRAAPAQMAALVPGYEEATFWNAQWTPTGANETTDMATTAVEGGTGALPSRSSYHAMTDPNLLGFGHTHIQLRPRRRAVRIEQIFRAIGAYPPPNDVPPSSPVMGDHGPPRSSK